MANGYNLVLPFVKQATARFIKAQTMQEVISLALVSGKFFIFYGRGGHAKSEFVQSVFDCIEGAESFVMSFGSDMTEDTLYGGVNLRAVNDSEDPCIIYDVEYSFLSHPLFIAEEAFDAPGPVVRSLKDTLTARQLRKGRQQYPMQTKCIGVLTNHQPSDISEKGDDYQALIERFPLQLVVGWDSYKPNDFVEMFARTFGEYDCPEFSLQEWMELQELTFQVEIPDEVLSVLAELIGEVHANGGWISPRTANHARDLLRASAVINGRMTAEIEDIIATKYLPGMEQIAATIEEKIHTAYNRAVAESLIQDGWRIYHAIENRQRMEKSPIKRLQYAALLEKLNDEVSTLIQPPQELRSNKESLTNSIGTLFRKLGGEADVFLDISIVLPERMLGIGYQVQDPQRGAMTIREQREWDEQQSSYHDDSDDSQDEEEEERFNPPSSPFRSGLRPAGSSSLRPGGKK